jgi:hypothetical protein
MTGVSGLLVTGPDAPRMNLWAATCMVTNWLANRSETWHVMVPDEYRDVFVATAAQLGLTVQLIEGSSEDETWTLLTGEEETGWTWRKEARYAEQVLHQEREYADAFVNQLLENAPETWDGDDSAEALAVDYVRHLEAEVERLGGSLAPADNSEGATP